MFKKQDPFTSTLTGQIGTVDTELGLFSASYTVTHYDDVQIPLGGTGGTRKYVLDVLHKISIGNKAGGDVSPRDNVTAYEDYPALLKASLSFSAVDGLDLQLLSYAPQTLNTKVQTSATAGTSTGQTQSSSSSATVGSSTAQTNSFGMSVGSFGDAFTGSASAEHSVTNTSEQSNTDSTEASQSAGRDSSASTYMSVKDWGIYSLVDPNTTCPSWIFGQEYPWDTFLCQSKVPNPDAQHGDQVQLLVPDAMAIRLYDTQLLYPPSQLSMFGINFVVRAQWLLTLANEAVDQPVTLNTDLGYFSASHMLDGSSVGVAVFMDPVPAQLRLAGASDSGISATLDLGVMGLIPIGPTRAAAVGFIPAKFARLPAPGDASNLPQPFNLFATSNDLLVRDVTNYAAAGDAGSGFAAADNALTATLDASCPSLAIGLWFKVIDVDADYTLHLKHWKIGSAGVMLTIRINGAPPIIKYVDALEAEGGEQNLLSITLRNQDFASIDYSDDLVMGLNTVTITIAPITGTQAVYAIRALSVEPS